MRSPIRHAIQLVLLFPALACAFTPINLSLGWNLVGNSDATAIDVATRLNSPLISSAWKWNKLSSKWAFYSPTMTSAELASYARSKDYEVLASIETKEGFWVNANAAVVVSDTAPNSMPALLGVGDLALGWNLVASADNKTPSQLNTVLNSDLGRASKAINSVWAWDAASSKWRLYVPSLQAQGGTVLADYIVTKGYLPFAASLAATDGYWMNITAATPPPSGSYLYLADDSINYDDGLLPPVAYTLAQFQSAPGLTAKWPMYNTAAITFKLADAGSFSVAAGQTLNAAVSISDTASNGANLMIKLYLGGVSVAQSSAGVSLSMPDWTNTTMYAMVDGSEVICKLSSTNCSPGNTNMQMTLDTTGSVDSSFTIGSMINSAFNSLSAGTKLTGTYKITVALDTLALRHADGSVFTNYTVDVPASFSGATKSVTGLGLEGYITF